MLQKLDHQKGERLRATILREHESGNMLDVIEDVQVEKDNNSARCRVG